jgi:uncharacterized membrane protein YebE (DUF533 family)
MAASGAASRAAIAGFRSLPCPVIVGTMDAHRLGRDVFLALAAIGWADGKLDEEEADAIVRTAVEEGLDLDEIAEIEKATKEPLDIGIVDRKGLSKADRLFVYAVASWMSRLDGVVDDRERDALKKLGDALQIPDRPREHADAIAREIAALPEGDRPARYDLPRLRKTIQERLEHAQRLRALTGGRLQLDVFLALAAVGYADGKLDEDEADALVRLALEEGLTLDEIDSIEKAVKEPVALEWIDHAALTKADRLFVYAVAAWMIRLKGAPDDREVAALQKLGDLLKIPERPREHAGDIAREVAERSESDGVSGYDIPALRETLRERLAEAQRLRAAAGEPE